MASAVLDSPTGSFTGSVGQGAVRNRGCSLSQEQNVFLQTLEYFESLQYGVLVDVAASF